MSIADLHLPSDKKLAEWASKDLTRTWDALHAAQLALDKALYEYQRAYIYLESLRVSVQNGVDQQRLLPPTAAVCPPQ